MNITMIRSGTIFLAMLALASCGGGGGSGGAGPVSSGVGGGGCVSRSRVLGIEGTGVRVMVRGIVESIGTGDIRIDCGAFSTAGAAVIIDGIDGALSDIRSGQVVTIVATVNGESGSGLADTIYVYTAAAGGTNPVIRLDTSMQPVTGGWYELDEGSRYSVLPTTTVLIDGQDTSPVGLAIDRGEVVRLRGVETFGSDWNPGGSIVADELEIVHLVDGPVDAVDLEHARLVVLGQTVLVPSPLEMPARTGDRLSVSGHPLASGEILATRITSSSNLGDFLVSGIVRSLDTARQRFGVNALTIDYSAAQLQNLPAGGPSMGDRVIVRGVRTADDSVLVASSIIYQETLLSGPPGALVSLHGIVTSLIPGESASVDAHPIVITAAALDTCTSSPDLSGKVIDASPELNEEVDVEGQLLGDGTVRADYFCISFFPNFSPSSYLNWPWPMLTGRIDSIDPVYGTLSILGINVQPLFQIPVLDLHTKAIVSPSGLQTGDMVEIFGSPGPIDGLVTISAIRRLPGSSYGTVNVPDFYVRLEDPLIYIPRLFLDQPIQTSTGTIYQWIDNGAHVPRAESRDNFFAGSRAWPFWDKICRPMVAIRVRMNDDGSLTAISILIEPDYC